MEILILDKILDELKTWTIKIEGFLLDSADNRFFFKTSNSLKDFLSIQTKKVKNLSGAAVETFGYNILSSTCYSG